MPQTLYITDPVRTHLDTAFALSLDAPELADLEDLMIVTKFTF